MKATQLRLGNYLQGKNTVVKVTRIFNEDEIGIGSGDPYTVSGETPCLLPIPLTEEWLLKCGFEKKGRFYRKGALTIEPLVDCFRVCISGTFIANVLFVHSLQNLYFCLSNKELSYEY